MARYSLVNQPSGSSNNDQPNDQRSSRRNSEDRQLHALEQVHLRDRPRSVRSRTNSGNHSVDVNAPTRANTPNGIAASGTLADDQNLLPRPQPEVDEPIINQAAALPEGQRIAAALPRPQPEGHNVIQAAALINELDAIERRVRLNRRRREQNPLRVGQDPYRYGLGHGRPLRMNEPILPDPRPSGRRNPAHFGLDPDPASELTYHMTEMTSELRNLRDALLTLSNDLRANTQQLVHIAQSNEEILEEIHHE